MPYGLGSFDCHRATLRRCPFFAAAVGIMQRGKSAPCIVVLRVRQGGKKADVRLNGETLEESQFFTDVRSRAHRSRNRGNDETPQHLEQQ